MSEWLVPFARRNASGAYNQNFLWRDRNTYVMDNHRAALWCWLQHFTPGERLSLLHIDWHTDTLYSRIDTWLKECPDLEGISIDDYLTHSHKTEMGDTPLFRWDNYLSIFLEKYGPQIDRCYFATHDEGDPPRLRDGQHVQYPLPWELPGNISYWLEQSDEKFIVNIDLDYFVYKPVDYRNAPLFSSEYFGEIFTEVKRMNDAGRIAVLTLCLSPEFTGGWDGAEQLCYQASEHLGLTFRLPDSKT